MRVGDLPYLELVTDGAKIAGEYRIRGLPLVVDIKGACVFTLDLECHEYLTRRLKEKYVGHGLTAKLCHKIADWLTVEYNVLSLCGDNGDE